MLTLARRTANAATQVSINFLSPFWRDLLLAAGFVDASFKSLAAVLQRQRSAAVVIGGAAEVGACSFQSRGNSNFLTCDRDAQALDAHPGTNDIILDKRKGFIRLALVTGTPIVPVFVFGESDLFFQVSGHSIVSTPSVWQRMADCLRMAFVLSRSRTRRARGSGLRKNGSCPSSSSPRL